MDRLTTFSGLQDSCGMRIVDLYRDCETCRALIEQFTDIHAHNGHTNSLAKVCALDLLMDHLWQAHQMRPAKLPGTPS